MAPEHDGREKKRVMRNDTSKPTAMPDPPLAVSAQRLSAMLGLSERTIRSMDVAGKLPRPLRLNGRSVRWSVREIQSWIDAGAPDRGTWEALKTNRKLTNP